MTGEESVEPIAFDIAHYPVEARMSRGFMSLRRIAALVLVIALFAAPIASAQSPEAVVARTAAPKTPLLSPAAFTRLVQAPRADATAGRTVTAGPPRLELRSLLTAPAAGRVPGTHLLAAAPQQRSWAARHKIATGIIIGVAAFFGLILVCQLACEE